MIPRARKVFKDEPSTDDIFEAQTVSLEPMYPPHRPVVTAFHSWHVCFGAAGTTEYRMKIKPTRLNVVGQFRIARPSARSPPKH